MELFMLNSVIRDAFDFLNQQSEYSAHLIYSAWWSIDVEELIEEIMVDFELQEIILTKIFMERHAIVSSVGI